MVEPEIKVEKDMDTSFKLNDNADSNLTCLVGKVKNVNISRFMEVFGDGYKSWMWDPECGYSGEHWTFEGPDGSVYTVYVRCGSLHVGGRKDPSDFLAWLDGVFNR